MSMQMWYVRCRQYAVIIPVFLLIGGLIVGGSSAVTAEDNLFEALGAAKLSEPIEVSDFALMSILEKETRLSDFAGKVVLLNFWTTW